MRRLYVILAVILSLLSGCAAPMWWKPYASKEEMQSEWVTCQALATQGSADPLLGGRINMTTQKELMFMCLEGKGWTRVSKQEAERLGLQPLKP
jgi:hypothetical protein